jgi:lipid A 4'-phosphatase
MEYQVSTGDRTPETMTQTRVQHALHMVVAGGFAAAFLFVAFPEIDIWVTQQFFIEPTIFALSHSDDRLQFIGYIRQAGFLISRVVMIGLLALLILACLLRVSPLKHYRKKMAYVLMCFILAPGLLVSAVLKENWGRARPAHIVEFGGKQQYTPPMVRSDQCSGNCSFASGEAAFGFCFLAFAMVARRRRFWIAAALAYGGLFAFLRVSQGGHFLSDVTFSALISVLTCLLLYRFLFEHAYGYDNFAGWVRRKTAPAIGALADFRNRLLATRSTVAIDWPPPADAANGQKPQPANDPGAAEDHSQSEAGTGTEPLAKLGNGGGTVRFRPTRKP